MVIEMVEWLLRPFCKQTAHKPRSFGSNFPGGCLCVGGISPLENKIPIGPSPQACRILVREAAVSREFRRPWGRVALDTSGGPMKGGAHRRRRTRRGPGTQATPGVRKSVESESEKSRKVVAEDRALRLHARVGARETRGEGAAHARARGGGGHLL